MAITLACYLFVHSLRLQVEAKTNQAKAKTNKGKERIMPV